MNFSMERLVQLIRADGHRRVAAVRGESLCWLEGVTSIYQLAQIAIAENNWLEKVISSSINERDSINYDSVLNGTTGWCILPSFDHPTEAACCLVTGTGLTHRRSAENRQAMHTAQTGAVTDSIRMYQWGLEGGRPEPGRIGTAPEWFYKGCGTVLRGYGEPLDVPPFALDGGDEAEIAGVYVIDPAGNPCRVGLTLANEFSDHKTEEKNYLYLAPSKLRTCSIGPELIVNGKFENARGTIRILRGGMVAWSKSFSTGEENMCHTVSNLEHHHFKYPAHRRPGDAHIHFFGADAFSFGEGVVLQEGDVMEIELADFGKPLRNPIRIQKSREEFVPVRPL
jgi:hypothetical protein